MATPNEHASLCQPSAFEKWFNCTASARYELDFPAASTQYTEEGRLAHSFCELYGKKKFTVMSTRKFNGDLKKLKDDPLFDEEMIHTAEFYVQYLTEKAMSFPTMPFVTFETKVDLTDYIPNGFGTCDCIMIGGDRLHITDYKHGKGVKVSALENGQMRLYALGALKQFALVFGDTIKHVSMAIVQPRITEEVVEDEMTVDELLAWGDAVRPVAKEAHDGPGTFNPGEHCRFCRGREVCRARAEKNSAFEDFKDFAIEGKADPALRELTDEQKKMIGLPPMLSDAEIGDLLIRAADLVTWYNDLKDYALSAILEGRSVPGWKAVEGRSNRAFTDTDKAFEAIINSGVSEEMLYKREPLTLTETEKLLGKKQFAEIAGSFVFKPAGKPALVVESDPRPDYKSAAHDFAGVDADG